MLNSDEEEEELTTKLLTREDGPQKMMTMRDQDQIVQELKKENFDLKLRLYMSQKNSETNDSKVSEYEEQLGAVLSRFEEQQKIYDEQQKIFEEQQKLIDAQARDLADAKQKSKALWKKNQNLEAQCKVKEEKIQNLSLSLNKISSSMVNLSAPKHYVHSRGGVQSMYFPDSDDNYEMEGDECDSELPLNSTPQIISRVAPMRRDDVSLSSYNDGVGLVDNERGRPSRNSYESTSSDPTTHITKNIYNTTINNPPNDNIGIVKPNNSRTVVDVEMPEQPEEPQSTKKKKKKGLLNVFKLCSGKSGQAMSREESIYHKKPAQPARITMTTYNNNVEP